MTSNLTLIHLSLLRMLTILGTQINITSTTSALAPDDVMLKLIMRNFVVEVVIARHIMN